MTTSSANPSALPLSIASKPWLRDFICLAAIWGASFLFTLLGARDFGAIPTAGLRVLVATLFLLPLLTVKGHLPGLRQHWKLTFFVGILNATVPMFGALVAWLWLKDRPNGLRILGLAIGFLGVLLLAAGKASFKPNASGSSSGLAIIACLFACLCYGIAASFTKRFLTGIPPLVTATGSQCGAALVLALPMLWLWPAQTPGVHAWLAIGVLGVLCTGVAYVLYFRLIANAGPARALTVTFLIPVFAVAYGVVFLSEAVTVWMLVCGVIIVCGTSLASGLVKWPAGRAPTAR